MGSVDNVDDVIAIYPISTPYQIMGLLHILAAVVAFGPLFMFASLRRNGETTTMAKTYMTMTFPALVLLWVLGMGLAGMSDDAFKMSQTWLVLSILDWVVLVTVGWFLIRPAITDASQKAAARMGAGIGVTHLGLVLGLILMIWKPGAPAGL